MKTRTTQRRPFWAALAVVASLFLALLITAPGVQANTGAGATILNTVQVDYKDAGGTQAFSANATTYTTVNLVKAGLSYSGMPTGTAKGKTAAMPSNQTVDSGSTASYLIALTANANGGDTYNLSRTIGAVTNMISDTVTYSTMKNDGINVITSGSPATVALGASVIQDNLATSISIPGNSNLAALITLNSAGYKVLVVNGVDYIVTGITGGTAPSNTHVGNTYYNTVVVGTAETLAVITLAANASGSNTTPAFTAHDAALKGTLVAEQILVKVDVTGTVGPTVGTDGTVAFTLSTTDSSAGNSQTTSTVTTTFRSSNVQIRKTVRNLGPTGVLTPSFAAFTTGNPADILEYKVEIFNAGASSAKVVTGTDAVPIYTKLVCGAAALGTAICTGTLTDIIATISDGTTTTNITYGWKDVNECLSPGVGAGGAAGFTEGSPLYFYMGNTTTCNGLTPAGGTVNAGATYTITYRVKMN
jgi:hypothetical protein